MVVVVIGGGGGGLGSGACGRGGGGGGVLDTNTLPCICTSMKCTFLWNAKLFSPGGGLF